MTERACAWCGKSFLTDKVRQKYCSGACRRAPWDASHRDERLTYWRDRYWSDHAAQAARARAWYCANRETSLANSRMWAAENRERKNAAQARRRARRAAVPVASAAFSWPDVLARHGDRCYHCGADGPLTMDHLVALARGGAHTMDNVVPACRPCNLRKGTKDQLEFLALLALEALERGRGLREEYALYVSVPLRGDN